jgi:phosphoribosylaminoimidazole-succinocarboxamide synthase
VHTPDSSRYWVAANYEERLAAGQEPESLDKEIVRRAYADAGYRGDGDPPSLAPAVWTEASARYIQAYETITATPFERGSYPVESRVAANLSEASIL